MGEAAEGSACVAGGIGSAGLSGISKSTVSKLCKDIDDRVNAFLDRPLVGDWPYLWLDATYLKQREGGVGEGSACGAGGMATEGAGSSRSRR